MLSDAVFCAGFEYHVYFVWKSGYDSQNLEIRVQFFNNLPPISADVGKVDFLSKGTKYFQTHAYFFSLSNDDSNGV